MKNKKRFFHLLLAFGLGISSGYAQESSNASGGDASGSGGTVAYSIGQTVYTYESGTNGNTNPGVQQPYEIYSVGTDEELSTISLITYPNPTSDYLILEFADYSNEKIDYQLIDLNGKVILNNSINNAQTTVDLNAYSKGIYFIKVIKESEEIKTFKIIKN
tara:strand:- start:296 stop:778 length:483 start_codon:yes stop_codon:yes gene_type:complete